MSEKFQRYLADRYPLVRDKFPGEGRRKWRLRVMEDFWSSPEAQADVVATALSSPQFQGLEDVGSIHADYNNDDDPFDQYTDGDEFGLLIRTDYTNDQAWNSFVAKVQAAEKDLITAMAREHNDGESENGNDTQIRGSTEPESDSESITPGNIIKIVSIPGSRLLEGISNLTALRLFNDVNIRLIPAAFGEGAFINPPNRLVDRNGLQEIYTGKSLWIFDQHSNSDECARLISQQSDAYGTATGDSWRAKAPHLPELQFNISCYNMKIDFGGLDKWDYAERARNLSEAEGM